MALAEHASTQEATSPQRTRKPWQTPWANRNFWVIVSGMVFLTINNIFSLRRDFLTIPPPWDQAAYLSMSLRYLHGLSEGGLFAMLHEFIRGNSYAAPLFPLTTVPLYLVFGASRLVAHLTHSVYLFLLLVGVYLLGKRLYGQRGGLLATFIIATFTAIINYSRDYLLEFPSAAFVTLGVYALLCSEDFRHRSWSIGFGALIGLSLLTKTMAGVFFVGPTAYALGRFIWQRRFGLPYLTNLLLSMMVAGLVASVWWGPNFRTALWYLVYFGFQEGALPYSFGGSEVFTVKNISYYFLSLAFAGTSSPYALLFIALMVSNGVGRIRRWTRNNVGEAGLTREERYLWMWLLVGYAILTVVPNKGGERYAQALLPPVALLLTGYIQAIDKRWLRHSVVATALLIGSFNYVGLTYATDLIPKVYYPSYSIRFAMIGHEYNQFSWIRSYLRLSANTHWPIEDILFVLSRTPAGIGDSLEFLNRTQGLAIEDYVRLMYHTLLKREPDEPGFRDCVDALTEGRTTRQALLGTFITSSEYRGRRLKILVLPNHPSLNLSTLQYYAELHRYPFLFLHYDDDMISKSLLREFDFVLVKNGGYQKPVLTPRYELTTKFNSAINAELQEPSSGFVSLPYTFAFPDDSHIMIFAARYVLK